MELRCREAQVERMGDSQEGEQEDSVGSLNKEPRRIQNAEVTLGDLPRSMSASGFPTQAPRKQLVTRRDKGNNLQPLPSPSAHDWGHCLHLPEIGDKPWLKPQPAAL